LLAKVALIKQVAFIKNHWLSIVLKPGFPNVFFYFWLLGLHSPVQWPLKSNSW